MREWAVLDKARDAWTATDVACAAGLEDPGEYVARRRARRVTSGREIRRVGLTTLRVCEAITGALAGRSVCIVTDHARIARDRLLEITGHAGLDARVDASNALRVRVGPGLVRVGRGRACDRFDVVLSD